MESGVRQVDWFLDLAASWAVRTVLSSWVLTARLDWPAFPVWLISPHSSLLPPPPASFPSHRLQISGVLDIQFNYFLLNFNLIYFFLDVKLLFTPTSLPNNLKVQESFFPLSSYLAYVWGAGWGGGPKEVRMCSTGGMFP